MKAATIRLSPAEVEAVSDRLSLRDCIGDALTDRHESEAPIGWDREDVEAAADRLHAQAIAGSLTLSTDVEIAVAIDAIEGATIHGHFADRPRKASAMIRALENAAIKVERATGRKVRLPE